MVWENWIRCLGVERYRSVDGIGVGMDGEGLRSVSIGRCLIRVEIREISVDIV